MDKLIFVIFLLTECRSSTAVTTIHHDKPEESQISHMAVAMVEPEGTVNVTLAPSERQKRLLPYENFYLEQPFNRPPNRPQRLKNYFPQYDEISSYQNQELIHPTNGKFTPFMESNALPGPFRSVPPSRQKVQYVPLSQPQDKVPDYGAIYDKLSQLKLAYRRPSYAQNYRPIQPQRFVQKPQNPRYKPIVHTKTTIETFTPTEIDIPAPGKPRNQKIHPADIRRPIPEIDPPYRNNKPFVNHQIAIEVPQDSLPAGFKPMLAPPREYTRKPYIVLQARPQNVPVRKPIILVHEKPHRPEIVHTYEVTPKFEDYDQVVVQNFHDYPSTEEVPKYEEFGTATPVYSVTTENSNNLNDILKQLQDSNTLPKTLTAENIDNSIKTLVRILEALKKQQKLSKPIVVQEEVTSDYESDIENEAGVGISGQSGELPGTVLSESYPPDTPEGGTPGKPGVDYPALSTIPPTSFSCKSQRYKGFFGDPDTNCQVWHYCDLNGGQSSFLCPNGTIFSQVALTCDWWFNVKCAVTTQLYVLNERLYKYIIPLSPKFPEDYSGPLVDKYLALKFQEMEEKMRKEKKGKGNADKENEIEEHQEIEDEDEHKISKDGATTIPPMRETLETIENSNNSD